MTAAEMILKKALVGSDIPSKEWSRIQAELRNRAFFSSTVVETKILYELRREVSKVASGEKSASEVRRYIRQYLAEKTDYAPDPGEEGTIKDLFSRARLDVIIKTNVDQARGWAQHLEATTPGALKAFPAYELVRVEEREQPRDWAAKWAAAGGQFYGSRIIALKTDSIWTRISRFGNPYPPFDYNSGMGVADVSRSECLALGVISEDDEPQTPPALGFNDHLQVEVPFKKNSKEWQFIAEKIGDQAKFDDKTNTIEWRSHLFEEKFDNEPFSIKLGKLQPKMRKLMEEDPKLAEIARAIGENSLTLTKDNWLDIQRSDGTDHRSHFFHEPDHPENIPLEKGDVDLLPSLWRDPNQIRKIRKNTIEMRIETFDGSDFVLQVQVNNGIPSPWTFFRTTKKIPSIKAVVSPRRDNPSLN